MYLCFYFQKENGLLLSNQETLEGCLPGSGLRRQVLFYLKINLKHSLYIFQCIVIELIAIPMFIAIADVLCDLKVFMRF